MKTLFAFFALFSCVSAGQILSVLNDNQISVKWTVNYKTQAVVFSANLGDNPPKSFIFGFSDHGQYNFSDAIIYHAGKKVLDGYIDRNMVVMPDLSQNVKTLRIRGNQITFKRPFTTCDAQDYSIESGTTQMFVAASWQHEIRRLDDNHVYKEMRFAKILGEEDDNFTEFEVDARKFRVLADEAKIPAETTTYWCVVKQLPDTVQKKKHHVIGIDPVIEAGNEMYVHHMEVFLCSDEVKEYSGNCNSDVKPSASKSCSHVIAAWAMGEGSIRYPQEAGLPLGGLRKTVSIMVEIHYNNPDRDSGVVDNSGVQFIVTPSLRQFDAGIMELGLVYSDANSIPPGQKAFAISGVCAPECTNNLPEEGINIFASQLHAHLTGRKLWTSHFRNGVKIGEVNRDMHYSPHWQHLQTVKPRVNVRRGDSLVTTCVYDTSARSKTTLGGYGIEDEMCVNYVYYYPASAIEVCKSAISNSTLRSYFGIRHELKTTLPIPELYNSVDWNDDYAAELGALFNTAPLNMNCLKADGNLFPNKAGTKRFDWEKLQQPKLYAAPFVKQRDSMECPAMND